VKGERASTRTHLFITAYHFEANWSQGTQTFTRKYSIVIEGDFAGYSAFVPELPTILVTA
jgi:hypothetical protein